MDAESALEYRFVLFFDFLGASNAAKSWPRERVHQFVDLLIEVAQVQSAQEISGAAQDDGSYRLLITPEVTTFSDNVVVSYPSGALEEKNEALESVWTEIVLKDAIRILHVIAERGLRIGLLIRGGLSFGQLYHNGDVVFGEAMVDAYTLESKTANNPRVIVSERVVSKLKHDPAEKINVLMKDTDGQWHLDYFTEMVRQVISPMPDRVEQATGWRNAHLELIDHEISRLEQANDGRATKWRWFKQQFERAMSEFPAYFQ
jgi:hypothetical protein